MISLGREPQVLVSSQKTSSRGAATDGIDPMRCLSPLRGSNQRDGFGTWGSRPRLNIFRASGAPGFVIEFRLKGLWTLLQRKDQSSEGEDGEGREDRTDGVEPDAFAEEVARRHRRRQTGARVSHQCFVQATNGRPRGRGCHWRGTPPPPPRAAIAGGPWENLAVDRWSSRPRH